ncbi:amino acid ABC transporter permease [Falsibacillus pallidus]|uniref:Amino acid ABC transporter membrane protein 1 (PAAT family) n=1 Tax=Falsibacillus pallidus TaxID=493781 RepID=A0A370G411_9BACI|nr:amino acid ABC transporter permease [Falsibacillus pallidus]RDI38485.1 amino acid ABC transporter membrane protein 1 (PAAT family) [Falsibacillus pallidus]
MDAQSFATVFSHIDEYWSGFFRTLITSLAALVMSFILGFTIASLRVSGVKPLAFCARWYVEFLRNTPLLVQIFFLYYALPQLHIGFLNLSGFQAGMLGLTFYTAAYIAEIVRAGIQSVPKGQMEAARSSGLSYYQAMVFIILPQAFRIVIPPLGSQFINLVKNSAVLTFFAGYDLMYVADSLQGSTGQVFPVYILAGVFYLILTIPLSILVNFLERKLLV